ncbi:MAG: PEP-CTERM sorting domain-containing protein [Chthoniobacter sp.]
MITHRDGTPFADFPGSLSINIAGTVAFRADLDGGGVGLFVGDAGGVTRVIGTGDTFNGSTVTSVVAGPDALNDLGQLSFYYALSNGTTGIAVVSVPEPAAGVLMIGAGLFLLLSRRRATAR